MKKLMLYVLCSIYMLSIVGCGTPLKMDESNEEMITLTLTSQYASDISDEWLEANIGTYHQSFERQADDAIVLKMTKEQYADYIDYIRSSIITAAQNMVDNDHNNITDISYNDNFSEFQITVKTDTLYRSDADSAYYMFSAYGRFYHYLTTCQYLTSGLEEGLEDWSVDFTYLDADGIFLRWTIALNSLRDGNFGLIASLNPIC